MQRLSGQAELRTVNVHRAQEEERLEGLKSLKDFVIHPPEFVLFSPTQFPNGNPRRVIKSFDQ